MVKNNETIGLVSGGFKPQEVCQLLEITSQTFRYWREHIYSHPKWEKISSNKLFIYRMIDALVRHRFIPTKHVSQCNWDNILSKCNDLGITEISKFDLVFDVKKINLLLVEAKHNPYHNQRSNYHQIVYLDALAKEHIDTFLNFGLPKKNIISINPNLKEVS